MQRKFRLSRQMILTSFRVPSPRILGQRLFVTSQEVSYEQYSTICNNFRA